MLWVTSPERHVAKVYNVLLYIDPDESREKTHSLELGVIRLGDNIIGLPTDT
jgi:hypothetical protein